MRYRFPTNQIMLVSWTSPLSNRLLLEVRGSYHGEVWVNIGGDEVQSNNRQLIAGHRAGRRDPRPVVSLAERRLRQAVGARNHARRSPRCRT